MILRDYLPPRSTSSCRWECREVSSCRPRIHFRRPNTQPTVVRQSIGGAPHTKCESIGQLIQLSVDYRRQGAVPRPLSIRLLSPQPCSTAFRAAPASPLGLGSISVPAWVRSPAHPPAMVPPWQRCRWQRGRDFALEPKLTALATRIFGATTRYEKLMWSS